MSTVMLPPIIAAAVVDSLGREWDPLEHPRGRDGKFIHTFKRIRAFLSIDGTDPWMTGEVTKINPDGSVRVRVTKTVDPNLVDPNTGKSYVGNEVDIPSGNVESINEKAVLDLDGSESAKPKAVTQNLINAYGFNDNPDIWKSWDQSVFPDLASGLGQNDATDYINDFMSAMKYDETIDIHDARFKEKGGHDYVADYGKYMMANRLRYWRNKDTEAIGGAQNDNAFRTALGELGVPDDAIDDTPDGMSGVQYLADKLNAWKKPANSKQDTLPAKAAKEVVPLEPTALREVEFGNGYRIRATGDDFDGKNITDVKFSVLDEQGALAGDFPDFASARTFVDDKIDNDTKADLTPEPPTPLSTPGPTPPPEPEEIDADVDEDYAPDIEPDDEDLVEDELPQDTEIDASSIRELGELIDASDSPYKDDYASTAYAIADGLEDGTITPDEASVQLYGLGGELADEADDTDNDLLAGLAGKAAREARNINSIKPVAELDEEGEPDDSVPDTLVTNPLDPDAEYSLALDMEEFLIEEDSEAWFNKVEEFGLTPDPIPENDDGSFYVSGFGEDINNFMAKNSALEEVDPHQYVRDDEEYNSTLPGWNADETVGHPDEDVDPELLLHQADSAADAEAEEFAETVTPSSTSPFTILAKDERGKSGDGFMANPGGPNLWGKYGAAGVMARHVDEDGTERFLLVRRGDKDIWQLPGGALEELENDYQGAAREIQEELNVPDEILEKLAPVGEVRFDHSTGWHYTNITVDVPEMFQTQVDGKEISKAKWLTREEIDGLNIHNALKSSLDEMFGQYDSPNNTNEPEAPADEPEPDFPAAPATLADFPPPPLTADEQWAIHNVYGYAWGYKLLNPYLHHNKQVWDSKIGGYRDVTPEEDATAQKAIGALDSAFAKAKELDHPVTVERRSGAELFPDESMVGKDIVNLGYTSTATKLQKHGYGYESKPIVWEITLPEGTKAIQANAFEKEILLNRGAIFHVTEDTTLPNGDRHVKMTYEPGGEPDESSTEQVEVVPESEPESFDPWADIQAPPSTSDDSADLPDDDDWVESPNDAMDGWGDEKAILDFDPDDVQDPVINDQGLEDIAATWAKEIEEAKSENAGPGPDSDDWAAMVDADGPYRWNQDGHKLRVGQQVIAAKDGKTYTVHKFENNNKGVVVVDASNKKYALHRKKLTVAGESANAPEPTPEADAPDLAPTPETTPVSPVDGRLIDITDLEGDNAGIIEERLVGFNNHIGSSLFEPGDHVGNSQFKLGYNTDTTELEVWDVKENKVIWTGESGAFNTYNQAQEIQNAVNAHITSDVPETEAPLADWEKALLEGDLDAPTPTPAPTPAAPGVNVEPYSTPAIAYSRMRIEFDNGALDADGLAIIAEHGYPNSKDAAKKILAEEWTNGNISVTEEIMEKAGFKSANLPDKAPTQENLKDTFESVDAAYDAMKITFFDGGEPNVPNLVDIAKNGYPNSKQAAKNHLSEQWLLGKVSEGAMEDAGFDVANLPEQYAPWEIELLDPHGDSPNDVPYDAVAELKKINDIPKTMGGAAEFLSPDATTHQIKNYRNAGYALGDAENLEVDSPEWNQAVNKAIYNLNQAGPDASGKLAEVSAWRSNALNMKHGGVGTPEAGTAIPSLPDGYSPPAAGTKAVYKNDDPWSTDSVYAVVTEDGTVNYHYKNGSVGTSTLSEELLINNSAWTPYTGGDAPVSNPSSATTLPDGFGETPPNTKAIYHFVDNSISPPYEMYATVTNSGKITYHYEGGQTLDITSVDENSLIDNAMFTKYTGPAVPIDVTPAPAAPDLSKPHMMDGSGKPMFIGDTVTWVNKGVETKVTVKNFQNNGVGVIVYNPATGKKHALNRKKLYVPKQTQPVSPNTTPGTLPDSGVKATKIEPDPSSPWFNQPKPSKPEPLDTSDMQYVDDSWLEKADANYRVRMKSLNSNWVEHPLSESHTYSMYTDVVKNGDKNQLALLLTKGRITQELHDSALHEIEGKAGQIQAQLDEYSIVLNKWREDSKAWRKANGLPSIELKGMDEGVKKMNNSQAKTWMNNHHRAGALSPAGVLAGPSKQAVSSQKGSSAISNALRSGKEKSLDPQWVATHGHSLVNAMDKAMNDSPPVVDDFITIRTFGFSAFINPDTDSKFSDSASSISNIVGTIQHDWGFAETSPGSLEAGATPGYYAGAGTVVMELRVPAGTKGVWTLTPGLGLGMANERGYILERGIAYYIHSANYDYTNGRWHVKAEIIPKDVNYDEFGHFINNNPFFD